MVLEGPGLYRMGLIDLLQEWTIMKRAERLLKIVFKGRCAQLKRDGISAIEPNRYAWRFVDHFGVKLLGMPPEEVKQVWTQCEEAYAALIATSSVEAPSVSVSIKSQASSSSGSRVSQKSATGDLSATEMALPQGAEGESEPACVASASDRSVDAAQTANLMSHNQSSHGAGSGRGNRERSRTPPPTTRC